MILLAITLFVIGCIMTYAVVKSGSDYDDEYEEWCKNLRDKNKRA